MAINKEDFSFGSGSFVGTALRPPVLYELKDDQATARAIGRAVGCPVVESLIDPYNRGAEAMAKRYGEIGIWYKQVVTMVQETKPDLHIQMRAPVMRNEDEPVGKYEPESVPDHYEYQIPPTETLVGYTLPRLMIKQIGKGVSKREAQDRMTTGLLTLEEAIPKAETPEELLAITAEGIAKADVDPMTTLKTILPESWMKEHNGVRAVRAVRAALASKAPDLSDLYAGLTPEERAANKII